VLLAIIWAGGPLHAAPLSGGFSGVLLISGQNTSHVHQIRALCLTGLVVFGIVIRKSTADMAKKLVARAMQSTGDYKEGVTAAGNDWLVNTTNSEANYDQGVQEAIAKKRFGKGVQKAGAAKYTKNAVELGSTRYGPGISNAQDAYARGVQPSIDVLKSLNLPPKGPKRSPQNRERAAAVMIALGALKDSN
jgi:hypothetical protein